MTLLHTWTGAGLLVRLLNFGTVIVSKEALGSCGSVPCLRLHTAGLISIPVTSQHVAADNNQ